MSENNLKGFVSRLCCHPDAEAVICGSGSYPSIAGRIRFYRTERGVLTCAEINGLPDSSTPCRSGVFGFHIHSGRCCTGTADDPFSDAKTHYNPRNLSHPYHAGDMPPLFSNCGYAFGIFLSDRFSVDEIMGRTVIIHLRPDDFTTQPSGNSGEMIACGQIR